MTEIEEVHPEHEDAGAEAVVSRADAWENGDGRRPDDDSGRGVVVAFGQTMKMLRLRAGLDREELGRRLGYSASTIAAFERGRRIPSPRTIDKADEALGADGLLRLWKDEVERAQYPVFFQGMAQLEKEAMELLAYDTLVVNGLLQTESYMRALLTMRRPPLSEDTIEQRVAARLARQDILDGEPAPLLSFVMDESILRRRYGGREVYRGQLEHLLSIGRRRTVTLQVMPLDSAESAGVDGPFTIVVRQDGKRFVYAEAQGTSSLEIDPARAAVASSRYGVIRSQALSPQESLAVIEGLLKSL
ncbi:MULTISPECIES: helix-turn-helix domain-containing protein [Streptomyces]|uniref:Helix-turn-helix domain-containing protein n=1 Tax=Streptomyces thermoviolaceus subsp. thermoviolaceus TaxID=66860 RepID=A0ABX0YKV4_STRTL|nr:helix-turn-helix transcriptional regulator [Streptomyces thermoviolaceus]NJP13127.1 helix-turn-helix domain-containing protein [Streptomyces thermoviolaceus subsp. thermoviolaceus]WTD47039.1 helix-turn-helix domain-containing protein [Streptomyces thermoviolaceus]GGV78678.1 transcriptional regulator [Streptomyces thermoviolaceus subsp. apingens]GHA83792.1 transcriptional regulator [Streptomyces thermoviolaceus subsp. thermoviolaceus]